MNISYENKMNLAFDKPLEYKQLLLYPATISYYSIFSSAEDCLDVSKMNEKNIELLRLPYLEYMYTKAMLNEDNFKIKWDMLICVLNIVLGKDQPFDVLKKDGKIYIKVYQRSENYELLNKEYTIIRNNFLSQYKDKEISKKDLEDVGKKITDIQEKMYNTILIGSEDFEEIRQLIMLQNDIKPQHYDAKTEQFLYNMKEKLNKVKKNDNDITTEDLITIVAYSLQKEPKELENMTIRRFNRFLNIITTKDDYYMYKQLEMSGMIKLNSEIPHWISHYEPKGKFDDIVVEGSSLMSSLKDGEQI
ncbi:MAG: hypothetical protein ACLTPN_02685 [Clostridia bacterium]|jgi:hypothetical protein